MAKKVDLQGYLNSLPFSERAEEVERIDNGHVPPSARLVPSKSAVYAEMPLPKGAKITQKTTIR